MKTTPSPTAVAALIFFALAPVRAEFLGADAVLARATAGAGTLETDVDSQGRLRRDAEEFGRSAPGLGAAEAARQWLGLSDRLLALRRSYSEERVEFRDLVKALPGPAAWKDLRALAASGAGDAEAVKGARLVQQWFADRLLGDTKAMRAEYEELAAFSRTAGRSGGSLDRALDEIAEATIAVTEDRAAVVALLERRFAGEKEMAERERRQGNSGRLRIRVPDLVLLVGEKEATRLLRGLLATFPGTISADFGSGVRRMIESLALELADQLAAPQWEATCTAGGGPLYERLRERFGGDANQEDFVEAVRYAISRAVVAGDEKAAERILRNEGKMLAGEREPVNREFLLEQLVEPVRAAAAGKLLLGLMEKDRTIEGWDACLALAVQGGSLDAVLPAVDAALADPGLPENRRRELRNDRLAALLAADRVAEAAQILRDELRRASAPASEDFSEQGILLAKMGVLLKEADWLREGLAAARATLAIRLKKSGELYSAVNLARKISVILEDEGRPEEAEKMWIDVLAACASALKFETSHFDWDPPREALLALTGIYAAAGRSGDVLVLAERAPLWGATDLAAIYAESCPVGGGVSKPLGVCVAAALVAQGRRDEAIRIIETILPMMAGEDSAYALLVELLGAKAEPVLDRLAKLNAFEERPLIWKAKLLLDAGRGDEAERVARQAVQIDPSDGEQGPGDRMRVYAVLADIVAAKGDAKQAEFLRGVVKSIRLSERADRFYELGLRNRAIKLYEESLGFFADAYCIQSRLALRKSEAGDWEGAERHYRRAFELMPESFGRVESHCFGCEHVFSGLRQQAVAERVFARLAREQPKKPQVHYLLGYLYDEQGRVLDAVREYQKAVDLDPEYLNAWKKLASAPAAALSPGAHTQVALNLVRLDPAAREGRPDLDGVGDLAALWRALKKAEGLAPSVPAELFPLAASANAVGRLPDEARKRVKEAAARRAAEPATAGRVFSDQEFSAAAENGLEALGSMD